MIFKRLACWSCHGENGRGGTANPNAAAGHELVPNLKGVRDAFDKQTLLKKITTGTKVAAKAVGAVPAPYDCPAYPKTAVNELEFDDLYAYISSLAPKISRWSVK